MKKTLATAIAILSFVAAFAQGTDDAFLFSQTCYQGTAKAMGMGNALGAVGGDMTSICINPAGMGIYRSDEFTTTLSLMDNYHSSTYYGSNNGGNKMRLSIPNIGFVGTKQKSNYRPLRYTQFGIGLTRTNDFNMHALSKGINPTSSKIDDYLGQIRNEFYPEGYNGELYTSMFPSYQLEEEASAYTILPAWYTYLIDVYDTESDPYYSSPVPQGNIWQGQESEFKGRSEAWTFAGSANYYDKLFLGMSFDLAHIKRVGTRTFRESRVDGSDTEFNQWSYEEELYSIGWGANLKAGLIYHANHWLRFGAAFHSPTIYSFSETWQTETESQILGITRKSFSQESNYEYVFVSPLKWIGSMAFILGAQNMISLDAEYTNYGAARFKAEDYDYSAVNEDIKGTYGKTFNFRVGSEWSLGTSSLRLGAAYYGSPFGLGEKGGSVKKASCGISVPVSLDTTFDFAYELTYGQNYHILYDAGDLGIEPVTQKQIRNLVAATLKVRF